MKKVLITGGAGFIGSHLADRMLHDGNEVHIIDNLQNGRVEFTPNGCRVLYADIADPSSLRYVRQTGFDIVYHLAAIPRVLYSVEHPSETNDANIGKTVALLEACRDNVGRFVFTSSSSVYGDAQVKPTTEFSELNPASPYALQKVIGEKYCEMFSDLYGMDTAIVRPFNVFGPRQLANGAYGTVISSWIDAIKHDKELRVDGDGSQIRDMTHVTNVVDVFARVGTREGHLAGNVINAGTGTTVSNKQILAWLLKKHPACTHKIVYAPVRAGDVKATQADISQLRNHFDYSVLVDFWTGLEETYNWCMNSEIF
jgi:nucleoside-diphosphate-sugar epimerase